MIPHAHKKGRACGAPARSRTTPRGYHFPPDESTPRPQNALRCDRTAPAVLAARQQEARP